MRNNSISGPNPEGIPCSPSSPCRSRCLTSLAYELRVAVLLYRPPEERPAAVARAGAVVQVVVTRVLAADGADRRPDDND